MTPADLAEPPVAPDYGRTLAEAGRAAALAHDWTRARSLLEAALEAWGAVSVCDVAALGRVYDDLCATWLALGDVERAMAWGGRAVRASALARDEGGGARVELHLARALVRAGRFDRAAPLLASALRRFDALGHGPGRCHTLVAMAELALAGREPVARARALAAEAALLAARRAGARPLVAALECMGQIAEATGDTVQADRWFASTLRVLAACGWRHRRAECHARYAELLQARGDGRGSLPHYKEAVRLAAGDARD